jgi:Tfp pilus assembly protein PilF
MQRLLLIILAFVMPMLTQLPAHANEALQADIQRLSEIAQSGDVDAAMRAVDQLVADYPDEPRAHATRAQLFFAVNQRDQALIEVDDALSQFPDAMELLYAKGEMLLNMGDIDGARFLEEAAAQAEPGDRMQIFTMLRQVYSSVNNEDQLLRATEAALLTASEMRRAGQLPAGNRTEQEIDLLYQQAQLLLRRQQYQRAANSLNIILATPYANNQQIGDTVRALLEQAEAGLDNQQQNRHQQRTERLMPLLTAWRENPDVVIDGNALRDTLLAEIGTFLLSSADETPLLVVENMDFSTAYNRTIEGELAPLYERRERARNRLVNLGLPELAEQGNYGAVKDQLPEVLAIYPEESALQLAALSHFVTDDLTAARDYLRLHYAMVNAHFADAPYPTPETEAALSPASSRVWLNAIDSLIDGRAPAQLDWLQDWFDAVRDDDADGAMLALYQTRHAPEPGESSQVPAFVTAVENYQKYRQRELGDELRIARSAAGFLSGPNGMPEPGARFWLGDDMLASLLAAENRQALQNPANHEVLFHYLQLKSLAAPQNEEVARTRMRIMNQVLQRNAYNATVWFNLAEQHEQQGNLGMAAAFYLAAARHDINRLPAGPGGFYNGWQEVAPDRAQALLEQHFNTVAEFAESVYQPLSDWAIQEQANGSRGYRFFAPLVTALDVMKQAFQTDSTGVQIDVELANLHNQLMINPGVQNALTQNLLSLGNPLHEGFNQFDRAIGYAMEAETNTSDPQTLTSIYQRMIEASYWYSRTLEPENDDRETLLAAAINYSNKLLDLQTLDVQGNVEALLNLGMFLREMEQPDQAVDIYTRVIALLPDNDRRRAEALYYRASLLSAQDKQDSQARQDIRLALSMVETEDDGYISASGSNFRVNAGAIKRLARELGETI